MWKVEFKCEVFNINLIYSTERCFCRIFVHWRLSMFLCFWVETEDNNEKEVTPCTQKSNRVCFCKPGFYCTSGNNYSTHCHKPCVPCGKGTFSSTPSLDACSPHTEWVRFIHMLLFCINTLKTYGSPFLPRIEKIKKRYLRL